MDNDIVLFLASGLNQVALQTHGVTLCRDSSYIEIIAAF